MKITIFIIVIVIFLIIGIISYLQIRDHYSQNDPMIQKLKEKLAPVHPAVKNIKMYKGDKSYTINKKHVYLCIDDENGNYYDENSLCYVLLHEISHTLTPEIGHTPLFHKNFQELLDKAEKLGVYDPNKPMVDNYCNYN